jgi:endonuclease/exonuclease/phosphatase (EEP) superfamily protein YafD
LGAAVLAMATLGPVWRSAERPAGASETREVTIMAANVLGTANPSLDRAASVLIAANADVLAVVESPRAWSQPGSALRRHYPHSTAREGNNNSVILFSRLPLGGIVQFDRDSDTPAFHTANVDLGGGTVLGVTATHFRWPLIMNNIQRRQAVAVKDVLATGSGPRVLMGDFNAPPWSETMARVEASTGLGMVGGLRRTWAGHYPNPLRLLVGGDLYGSDIPAPLGHHIDHALFSRGIGIAQTEVIPVPGSDHRAIWHRIAVPVAVPTTQFARR